jgi:8-oxo-dGTP pyrophosphatase MutT (NUDIX family)
MSSTGSAAAVVDAEPPLSTPEDFVFPEQILEYDHYKGVTIHWKDASANLLLQQPQTQQQSFDESTIDRLFVQTLQHQLALWKANGTRGVWLHVDPSQARIVPWAIQEGFEFHMVLHPDKTLILSQWLPTHTPSRLPHPPSHQIGVGCLVWHPEDDCMDNNDDDDRRLLVVQEKTGPAAKFGLWKMPTGLADPSEDIPDAAVRELLEETGLHATFDGMVGFRQAHSTPPTTHTSDTKKWGGVSRKASDLFFVCQLSLKNTIPQPTQTPQWTACPQEIAAIQWMKVSDYCQQERWQFSPLYQQFNQVIRHAAQYHLWEYQTLPLRNDDPHGYTNTLYYSKKITRPEQPPPTSSEEEGDTASKL